MGHNIFHDRFFNRSDTPAWHKLGDNRIENISAVQAYERYIDFQVYLEGIQTASGMELPYKAIMRSATTDDPEIRQFGIVGDGYHLITPDAACRIHTENITAPIETIGALAKGSVLFITTALPEFVIGDDDAIRSYLAFFSPMNGSQSALVKVVFTRVVCQNTLLAALSETGEEHRINHNASAEEDLAGWLKGIEQRSISRVNALKSAFEMMANVPLSKADGDEMVDEVYALPRVKDGFATDESGRSITAEPWVPGHIAQREAQGYAAGVQWIERHRQAVKTLWGGKGRGMDMETANGTLWGWLNAVSEWETHRNYRGDRANDLLRGNRAGRIESAYEKAMVLVR